MSLGGRDDIYPAVGAYRTPTPASGRRNRYAEIMSQYGQAQPFSFFGYPEGYTGGFTPYERLVTPQAALPIESASTTTGAAGGGGRVGDREGPSAWSQMTPAERAAYYAANPTEGRIALGAQDLFGNLSLMGQISKYANPDAFYNYRLEKQGLDPESFAYGPPDPNFSSQAAAAARNEAMQAAITAANAEGAGIVANPMAQDPAQRAQAQAVAGREYGTGAVPPGVSENQFAANYAAYNNPNAVAIPSQDLGFVEGRTNPSSLLYGPNPSLTASIAPTAPVVTAPIVEALPPNARLFGTGEVPPDISENDFYAAQAASNLPSEIQSLLSRYPALVAPPAPVMETPTPVVAPAPIPAYVAPAPEPVQMVNVTERWNGEDAPEGGGWTRFNLGRGEVGYQRTVSVPVSGGGASGGGSGGYTVGGYAPGSQAAAAAASGQFGMGPGTPGFNSGGAGFAKGGYVSMQHLGGPNPMGPDDGYAALKDGEFVINDKAVKKYGIELMNAINSGKISKGKLRGLLEM